MIGDAAVEVGPALFFSLLIITLSFVPVFTLRGAGRAAVLAAGVHQDLRDGGGRRPVGHAGAGADGLPHPRTHSATRRRNPLNRVLIAVYRPLLERGAALSRRPRSRSPPSLLALTAVAR